MTGASLFVQIEAVRAMALFCGRYHTSEGLNVLALELHIALLRVV